MKKYRPIGVEFKDLPIEKQVEVLSMMSAPRIQCPFCQREIPDYSIYCQYCAKKLPLDAVNTT